MSLKDKNLSLQFYNYLCDMIGSQDVVRTRRNIFNVLDIVNTVDNAIFISSGSKAEGLDLKGSDYDQMQATKIFRVYESLNHVQSATRNIKFHMDTNDTKPGFTKLKLVNKSYLVIGELNDLCETVGKETYISSKRFRETDLPDYMIIHGPCQSSPDGGYDQANCLRCKEWITPAQQWIHRSRTAWPDYILVDSIVQYGVLFVPIGCKDSPNEDLQWRISFSMAEKQLIHSFSHTQLLCYALMKIILNDIIKPRHGDLLCSYFLKTIMFWLSEETSPLKWKPENIISCFLDCLKRIIYCAKYKTCLHYFIPENNLFEDRFTDSKHKALLDTLRFIYISPWICLFETSTFQNYSIESVNSQGIVLSASELSCYSYINMINVSFTSHSIHSAIKRLVNVLLNRELCTYMISVYAREVIQSSHICNIMARNKSFYQQYKRTTCYFKISLLSDSISSWLLLASLLYKCKRFQECLVIINYILSRCTLDGIHLTFTNNLVEQTVFKEMKQRCGLLLAFKYWIIGYAVFRRPFCLLPDELVPLIIEQGILIPSDVYSYLLQFLCCYHLRNYTGKQNALHDLELTIRDPYFILSNVKNLRIVNTSLDIVKALI